MMDARTLLSDNNKDPIGIYETMKKGLVKELETADGTPWMLVDYPGGIYTYGNLSKVCKIFLRSEIGHKVCEESLEKLVQESKHDTDASLKKCWTGIMEYITLPITVGGQKRIFLIGQRMDEGYNTKNAAIATLNQYKSYLRGVPLAFIISEKLEVSIKELEDAYKTTKPMSEKTRYHTIKIVNEYKRKIEEAKLDVNFKELESYAKLDNKDIQLKRELATYTEVSDSMVSKIEDVVGQLKKGLDGLTSPWLQNELRKELGYWEIYLRLCFKIKDFEKLMEDQRKTIFQKRL